MGCGMEMGGTPRPRSPRGGLVLSDYQNKSRPGTCQRGTPKPAFKAPPEGVLNAPAASFDETEALFEKNLSVVIQRQYMVRSIQINQVLELRP
jgi:hypothetical protein